MSWRSPIVPWLAAALSGLLLTLCYAPWNHDVLVWIWAIPLLSALWFYELPEERKPTRTPKWMTAKPLYRVLLWLPAELIRFDEFPAANRRWVFGLKLGLVSGFCFFASSLWWVGVFVVDANSEGWARFGCILLGALVVFVMCAYLGLFFGLWGAFAATIGRLRWDKISPGIEEPIAQNVKSEKLRKLIELNNKQPNMMTPSLHSLWIALINSSCWVSLEWLRSWMIGGFGWNGLGVPFHRDPNLIQITDVVGVTGLAFLPMFCVCVGLITVARFRAEMGKGKMRPHVDFGVTMLLVILTFFYGLNAGSRYKLQPEDTVELRLALIQGNVPVEQRWSGLQEDVDAIYAKYERATAIHTRSNYDLIVWPETSLPYPFYYEDTLRTVNAVLAEGDFQLIFGNEDWYPGAPAAYNSMFLARGSVNPDDGFSVYHKKHLVPFGEYVPFRNEIPLMHTIFGGWIPYDFNRGKGYELLRLEEPDVGIIPTICFEDTLGRLTRRFAKLNPDGPQMILNLTNDGWFKSTPGAIHHLANAKFRAVELRRPMARCANTGVTCVIDIFGNVEAVPPFAEGFLSTSLKIDATPPMTIYARFGDWFAITAAILTVLLIAGHLSQQLLARRRRED